MSTSDAVRVVTIDAVKMLAIAEDGFSFPITHRFDAAGDETDDWAETLLIVAGPDSDGMWHRLSIAIDTAKPN